VDNNKLKIIYMGTPDFAVPALQALINAHEVIAVYTRAPKPKGRGRQIQKTPVHEAADAHTIPVFTPGSFKKDEEAVARFRSLGADVAVVAAYGLILPVSVLGAPRLGCLNIHASLLPRWRGASPIQHAIWSGDALSGITIMQMEEGLDTGPMLMKREIPIEGMTTPQLHDALSVMGAEMILQTLENMPVGEKQDDTNSTYAPMLKKEDGRIDWTQDAPAIDRQVRALNPWPSTFTQLNGKRLRILKGRVAQETASQETPGTVLADGSIVCGHMTVYAPEIVQPDNANAMDMKSAMNGGHVPAGAVCKEA